MNLRDSARKYSNPAAVEALLHKGFCGVAGLRAGRTGARVRVMRGALPCACVRCTRAHVMHPATPQPRRDASVAGICAERTAQASPQPRNTRARSVLLSSFGKKREGASHV